jgi:glutamine synthetase
MAEELSKFADILEQADDFDAALQKLVHETLTAHQRIIFNGNGYAKEWADEAAKRGLSDLRTTTDAIPTLVSDKNVDLVTRRGIFSKAEYLARYEIHLEDYRKRVNIEAKTTVDMAMRQIFPTVSRYCADLAAQLTAKQDVGCSCKAEKAQIAKLSALTDELYERCEALQEALKDIPACSIDAANYFSHTIVPLTDAVRQTADALELLTDKSYWPFPTYADLLFY